MKLHKSLASTLFALATLTSTSLAAQHVLLVGIEDYSSVPGAPNLPGCLRDVDVMHNLLTRTFGILSGNIMTLTNRQATKDAIVAGIRSLAAKAEPGNSVVFYFTGHGAQVPDFDGDESQGLRI